MNRMATKRLEHIAFTYGWPGGGDATVDGEARWAGGDAPGSGLGACVLGARLFVGPNEGGAAGPGLGADSPGVGPGVGDAARLPCRSCSRAAAAIFEAASRPGRNVSGAPPVRSSSCCCCPPTARAN